MCIKVRCRTGYLMSRYLFRIYSGLPTVPYFTEQYRILTPVPSVPYGTESVPFLSNFVI